VRILHVINTLDPSFGGPVEAVRQFALATTEDHDVEVLCLDNSCVQAEWPIPVNTVSGAFTKYRFSLSFVPWLRSNARRFDAVIVHGVWHYHTVGTWLSLRRTGVPYFVILHGMLHPWFRKTYPLKHLKKALFWYTLVHRALQNAAAVIFLCDEERRLAPGTFRMRLQGSAVAPLGIREPDPRMDSSCGTLVLRFPELRNRRILLFLGRICRMKACDSLLRAFSEICPADPDLHLAMSGPDFEGWQPELMRLAEKLGIQHRVTWTGPLYGNLKWEALQAAELFVLPSHCETFPVAVLEALGSGTPVLISDQVGIYREVRDAAAGLICQDDGGSLVEAMQTWVRLDAKCRAAYRSAAHQCFREHFELHAATARQINVIRQFSGLVAADIPSDREQSVAG
jgi:glycosyltransferase involved in cell wall biosynthesis